MAAMTQVIKTYAVRLPGYSLPTPGPGPKPPPAMLLRRKGDYEREGFENGSSRVRRMEM